MMMTTYGSFWKLLSQSPYTMLKVRRFSTIASIAAATAVASSSSSPSSIFHSSAWIKGGNNNIAHNDGDLKSFSPKEFRSFKIIESEAVSPNTKRIVCALPSKDHVMGMDVASLVMIKGQDSPEGKVVARPYTPTTLDADKGFFELVIKGYPEGNVSKYLCNLKAGDEVEVKGPFAKIKYEPNMKKEIGMIAGGSGITPMLQVIQYILRNPDDKTKVHLIFANNGDDDILLKDKLDALEKKHDNFNVTYILSTPSPKWKGEKGFVSKELISSKLPKPSNDSMIFICGPPPMYKALSGAKGPKGTQGEIDGALKDLGYTIEQVYKF